MRHHKNQHLHKLFTVLCTFLTVITLTAVEYKKRHEAEAIVVPPAKQVPATVEAKAVMSTPVAYFKEDIHPTSSQADVLAKSINEREQLLGRRLAIKFVSDTGQPAGAWTVHMKDHPDWIMFEVTWGKPRAVINADTILAYLEKQPIERIVRPGVCSVLSTKVDEMGVERATTDCITREGHTYDPRQVATAVKRALERPDTTTIDITLPKAPGTVQMLIDGRMQTLELIGAGKSDFAGSGYGRKENVRKAINEKLHNVVIPPTVEFSYNSVLGDKISKSRGWHDALTIFEGVNLRMAPGGGVCQSSTTMFRAVMNAGFPVIKRKSHSMYVTYYAKHGIGLDATIFPGLQDFVFVNDTGYPVLVQSYTEGDEAFVNIYGIPDGRRVAVEGPYFSSTAPKDLLENGKPLRGSQIAWIRRVLKPNEAIREEVHVSSYNSIPRNLATAWPLTVSVTGAMPVHAAAQ